jgi:CheY-like chemotaxis protein
VKGCLEDCGHQVFLADTFVKAQQLICNHKIDLIISDVHLENGGTVFDFLRWVKKSEQLEVSTIPFVLFSSKPTPMAKYLADGIRISSRTLGAIKYVEMETFDAAEFRRHINSVLPVGKQLTKSLSVGD